MAVEIERKFLVNGDFKKETAQSVKIVQGYLCSDPESSVRVRISGENGYLTIKGGSSPSGMSRFEWEKAISINEARELIKLCTTGLIEKTRYSIAVGNHLYEVDEFHGTNQGLLLAEIELGREDEPFAKPHWLGREVTGDVKYYNMNLAKNPLGKTRKTKGKT